MTKNKKQVCHICKKEAAVLKNARNAYGVRPKSKTANKYCIKCEEDVYQLNLLKEYLHKWFIKEGYYEQSDSGSSERKRIMAMIHSQIKNLKDKDGFSYEQIKMICIYILEIEKKSFTENILGLVPFYYMKTKQLNNELWVINNSKKYGKIKEKVIKTSTKIHKPNKQALRLSNMEDM